MEAVISHAHINNLHTEKNNNLLLFRECYEMEKIDGSSATIGFTAEFGLAFAVGKASAVNLTAMHDAVKLTAAFKALGHAEVEVEGEFYGGSVAKMSATYGPVQKFIAFDVKIGGYYLSVPDAAEVAAKLGLEFVAWSRIPADLESFDRARAQKSRQAARNGCGTDRTQEGIILRPLVEMVRQDGQRVIAKYKNAEFSERASKADTKAVPTEVLAGAEAIANEFVTDERLRHVLAKMAPGLTLRDIPTVIKAMTEDVLREGKGELVESPAALKAISVRTVTLFRQTLKG